MVQPQALYTPQSRNQPFPGSLAWLLVYPAVILCLYPKRLLPGGDARLNK